MYIIQLNKNAWYLVLLKFAIIHLNIYLIQILEQLKYVSSNNFPLFLKIQKQNN